MPTRLYHDEEPDTSSNQGTRQALEINVVPLDFTSISPDQVKLIVSDEVTRILSDLIQYALRQGGE